MEEHYLVSKADKAQTDMFLCSIETVGHGRPDRHAEAGLESCDLLVAVGVEVLLRVIDCHAAVDTVRQGGVLHDGDALVGAVLVLEEHCGGPVVT
jgi:hypothetical protein